MSATDHSTVSENFRQPQTTDPEPRYSTIFAPRPPASWWTPGASTETLRSNLGWKSREVVERYVKAFEQRKNEAVEAVADALLQVSQGRR